MRRGFALAFGLALALPGPAQAEVRVMMKDGLVTLTANGATVREILAEWAKVGQTRIVNAERISGAPITMQLTDMPEAQALDIVLRSVSGYLAAPRAEISPALSRFDRILVLPTSSPPRNTPPSTPPPSPPPSFQPPPFLPPADADADDDRDRLPPGVVTPRGGGVFNPFPQQGASPNDPPPPVPAPAPAPGVFGATPGGKPVGVSVPGMVVPAPAPQQPGFPPPPDQR